MENFQLGQINKKIWKLSTDRHIDIFLSTRNPYRLMLLIVGQNGTVWVGTN